MTTIAAVLAAMLALTPAESNELKVARCALRDGLWAVAREHAILAGTNEVARLVILESYAGENRWSEISKRLEEWKNLKGIGFDYYRAVTGGDHVLARRLLAEGGSTEGLAVAQLYEAESLIKAGDRKRAEELWSKVAANNNAGERAVAIASMNLGNAGRLREVYATVKHIELRRRVGLRLGMVLINKKETLAEGERIIRSIAVDAPDVEGAMNAFVSLADALLADGRWKEALAAYREVTETWPVSAKMSRVNAGIGWAQLKLGNAEDALSSFVLARENATDDASAAMATIKEGDALTQLNRIDEGKAKYLEAMKKYPKIKAVEKLAGIVKVRDLEAKGRQLYREYRFEEARKLFLEVAAADASRITRMKFYSALCLYGQGRDEDARSEIAEIDDAQARLWLAKYAYNRREWKEAKNRFVAFAASEKEPKMASVALVWAARAALFAGEYDDAIRLATEVQEKYPKSAANASSMVVQGEALIEKSRYDEAELVIERALLLKQLSTEDRRKATLLRADVLYAMGADNPRRYEAAKEAYSSMIVDGLLTDSDSIVVSFKLARTLEKMQRLEEAIDFYYVKVVLAYRAGRERGVYYHEDARAAFSRAAFRLVDEYESQGKERQSRDILELIAGSDVPASTEARKRIEKIDSKGKFL